MKKPEIITIVIVALTFLASILAYPSMPDRVASHWNMQGGVNGYMMPFWGTFLVPIISLAVFVLLQFFIRADPLIKGTKKFKVYPEWVFVMIVGFMAYVQLLLLAFNLGVKFNFTQLLMPSFGVLFIFLGYLMQNTPRNYTIGIRTPWTLADDSVWQKTHERGGLLFKAAGLISFIGVAFPKFGFHFMFFPVIFAAVYSVFYSYFVYKALPKNKTKKQR